MIHLHADTTAAARALGQILARAGVVLDGPAPWDPRIHDQRVHARVLSQGALGLGESYVDGWWDCDRLDELIARLLRSDSDRDVGLDWRNLLYLAQVRLLNRQSVARAGDVARAHYDLGNDFFRAMLGRTLNYSCGYWRDANTLDEAQDAKMDLICKKLQLRRGERLLDIGCGWGSLLRHAVERYGCQGVGITVSVEQARHAEEALRGTGARVRLADWRDRALESLGPFDKIVSVGMFEHVGRKNYRAFFSRVRRLLVGGGLFLLHTIGNDHSATDAWVDRYLFPNGMLPAAADLASAFRGRFVLEDWHSFGADYDRTLMAWHANFERHAASPEFDRPRRFYRLWRYYLLSFAGAFRARNRNQLWQLVLSPRGVGGGYASLR